MKIRTRGNKNADETTDIVFTIKSTNQCYRATMAIGQIDGYELKKGSQDD